MAEGGERVQVDFRTEPGRYKHWRLSLDGRVATLAMDVREDGGLRPGYELKLNSYDLGVDIELYDAVQRLRFEHPEVGAVILRSAKERVFCAGANIRMLGQSSHGWKVNFCKFTNETRNSMEEASGESGQVWVAARDRAVRRRRLRAGAGLRADRDGRRRQHLGGAPRSPAAGRAAGYRRPDAPDRQAQGPSRPRRLLLDARGGHQGQAGGGVEPGRRGRAALAAGGASASGRARAGRSHRSAGGCARHHAHAAGPHARGRPPRVSLGDLRASTAAAAWPRSRWPRPTRRRRPTAPACISRAWRSGRWRWRASSTT